MEAPSSVAVQAAVVVLGDGPKSPIWGAFAAPAEFIICTNDGGTLYSLNESPRQPADLVPLTWVHGLYYSSTRPSRLEDRCFYLDYWFEGRAMLSFPQIDSIYSIGDPVEALAIALVHEEFHRFQRQVFEPTLGSGDRNLTALEKPPSLPDTLIASPSFRHLAGEERDVLAEALEAPGSSQLLRLARDYIELRNRRLALVPGKLRDSEAHEERKEGSAHYAAYRWLAAAEAWPASRVSALVRSDLLSTPAFDKRPSQFRHWRIYATGAAIGLLLDKLGASWRQEVQDGATLFDRLQVVVRESDSVSPVLNKR